MMGTCLKGGFLMKRRMLFAALILIISVLPVMAETKAERVHRKGGGLEVLLLKDTLEKVTHRRIIEILPACFKQSDGQFKAWVTILYEDNNDFSDKNTPFKLILGSYSVYDQMQMRLERLVLCPCYSSINVRGQISIESPDPASIKALFKTVEKDAKLSTDEAVAVKKWVNSWQVIGYDPDWQKPEFKW
jgi:hypothetical protein